MMKRACSLNINEDELKQSENFTCEFHLALQKQIIYQ